MVTTPGTLNMNCTCNGNYTRYTKLGIARAMVTTQRYTKLGIARAMVTTPGTLK